MAAVVNKVVFLRHGESVWNVANIFTGWHDVELSPAGHLEAIEAGKCLREKGYKFDVVFTSVLERAIQTAWTACSHSKNFSMPVIKSWRLNERHYGGLQGMNKAETAAQHGDAQVKIWRRSFDIPPPQIETSDPRHPSNDPLYAGVPKDCLPGAESLALTVKRVLPFWNDNIAPFVMSGRSVLVAAHGNSLRALCMYLEDMSQEQVLELNIPTAVPLVYELDQNLNFIRKYYLMDEIELAKKMAAVANQGKAGGIPAAMTDETTKAWDRTKSVVSKIYGSSTTDACMGLLMDVVKEHLDICKNEGVQVGGDTALSTNDATLIVYANTFQDKSGAKMPMTCLNEFCTKYKACETMKCVHMLPMFPWDTDRGFSVMDYFKVDPAYGDWTDVTNLSKVPNEPAIMFDYVCNHASVANPWVQGGLIQRHIPEGHPQYEGMQKYEDFCTAYSLPDGPADDQPPPDEVLARLTRPRNNPVLTQYFVVNSPDGQKCTAFLGTPEADGTPDMGTVLGKGLVWTTFSRGLTKEGKEDTKQVDLNYRNPNVLAEVVRVLLFYVRKGSTVIRLDAIGYIWKVLGSNSIHERGCHMVLASLYQVLHIADPRVITIAEVNEPVGKCLTYLGSEELPESNMAYNFAPFPMALHAQATLNVNLYLDWMTTLAPWKGRAFLTVLGSHDGLAQKQVRDILAPEELERLQTALLEERGGLANYALAPGGKKIVYEACGTPWCLVNGVYGNTKETFEKQLARYINCLCLGLIPRGMPGIYAQGLVGALNWTPPEGLDENRTLNRESFDINTLFPKLDDPTSQEGAVYRAVQGVLKKRCEWAHFDRSGPEPQPLVELDPAVLAVLLEAPADRKLNPMLIVINVANEKRTGKVQGVPAVLQDCPLKDALGGLGGGGSHQSGVVVHHDDVKTKSFKPQFSSDLTIELEPYEVLWLVKE